MAKYYGQITLSFSVFLRLTNPALVSGQTAKLPTLKPIFTSSEISLAPKSVTEVIKLSPSGVLFFQGDDGLKERFVTLTPQGKLNGKFGIVGSGPGEVRVPIVLGASVVEYSAYDRAQGRIVVWKNDGSYLRTVQVPVGLIPVAQTSHGWIAEKLSASPILDVYVINSISGLATQLILPSDTFVRKHFGKSDAARVKLGPIFGEWSGGFNLLDPNSYSISFYAWSGSFVRELAGPQVADISPAETRIARQMGRIEQLALKAGRKLDMEKLKKGFASTVLPRVAPGNVITTDGSKRLWVFGQTGDGGFADVFTETKYIGRVVLDCPGFEGHGAVSGQWLAVVCAPADPSFEGDAVIRFFKIS